MGRHCAARPTFAYTEILTMQLQEVIMVQGRPGLFRVLSTSRIGMVVEDLTNSRRTNINSQTTVAGLGDISLYTEDDDQVALSEILARMDTRREALPIPDPKVDDDALKAYFTEVFPEHDRARVYASVMRKVARWFHLLDGRIDFQAKNETPEGETSPAADALPNATDTNEAAA